MVVHAPRQYEIVCLRSVNTENQEHLFQQAKKIAASTTNRKPENVIPSIMLRLQAKQINGKISSMYQASETEVKKIAAKVPSFSGTSLTSEFITSRSSSWQGHLERISTFLVLGEGVWWEKSGSLFVFHDADTDLNFNSEGPELKHFRTATLQDIAIQSQDAWKRIVQEKISLPSTRLCIFDEYGDLFSFQTIEASNLSDIEFADSDLLTSTCRMKLEMMPF